MLFGDASTVDLKGLRRDAGPVVRLLVPGLLLTIVSGTFLAFALLPGITLGLALLIGSALAPTDAALGQPVITDHRVPARIRRILNVESGLNDGIATPFVYLALALATAEATGSEVSIGGALQDGLIGAVWRSSSAPPVACSSWLQIAASGPRRRPASSPSWRCRLGRTWWRWPSVATASSPRSWVGSRSAS